MSAHVDVDGKIVLDDAHAPAVLQTLERIQRASAARKLRTEEAERAA
jgi:hypothetical protein